MMELSESVQTMIRAAYGTLMCLWMIAFWRNRAQLLVSETWGGYVQALPSRDCFHSPLGSAVILSAWSLSTVCIATGIWPLFAAAINWMFCWYFFIGLRWQSLARGCGAPGFIANWMAVAVFLLEFTSLPGTLTELRHTTIRMLRVDFAFIFLSAGIYKFFSGYRSGAGMEYGMANPMWGYWHRQVSGVPPSHPLFKVLNFFAWSSEIVAATLMLIPAFMGWGGLLFTLIFIFIATQIRLGWLCHMAVLIGCLYANPGDFFSDWVFSFGSAELVSDPLWVVPHQAQNMIVWAMTIHTVLIPVCFMGIWYNQLAGRRLPVGLQKALDLYANTFGIIIWRVFSSDLTRFVVTVRAASAGGPFYKVSEFGEKIECNGSRFGQVFEAITVVCLFTTLNYFPHDRQLFWSKLVRYARSLGKEADRVSFEINVIEKSSGCFERRPSAVYTVDTRSGKVTESEDDPDWFKPVGPTLVFAGTRPGSYAPKCAA